MSEETEKSVFKSAFQKSADKRDETTRASQEIVGRETVDRDAKTARPKALRLDRDAQDAETVSETKSKLTKTKGKH